MDNRLGEDLCGRNRLGGGRHYCEQPATELREISAALAGEDEGFTIALCHEHAEEWDQRNPK